MLIHNNYKPNLYVNIESYIQKNYLFYRIISQRWVLHPFRAVQRLLKHMLCGEVRKQDINMLRHIGSLWIERLMDIKKQLISQSASHEEVIQKLDKAPYKVLLY